jgi:ribonuclease HII
MAPGSAYEQEFFQQGYDSIAGLDEAGRGCWAGPVVAAAVVLPPAVLQQPDMLAFINDSKALSAVQRDASFAHIQNLATGIGTGIVPAYLIDTLGIVPATRLAMTIALVSLACRVDALLIDALTLPGLSLPQQAIIRGDALAYSIAAASIIAKVTRDRLMIAADNTCPGYGFAAHKGYGTATHRQALDALGPCHLHRMSFRPVMNCIGTPCDTAWYTGGDTTQIRKPGT